MFHQTFQPGDLLIIGVLIGLECLLSIDNALVLGVLARKLPEKSQKKALTYGMIGAVFLRLVAVVLASELLRWRIVNLIGGGYLIYVAAKHLWTQSKKKSREQVPPPPVSDAAPTGEHAGAFWKVVISIELTDLVFAIDSILAAIALIGDSPPGTPVGQLNPKLWVVVVGGLIGVVAMRFAAVAFIKLLDRFPRFELSAYLLVAVIGIKLILEWLFNGQREVLDFRSLSSPACWIFWALVAGLFAFGFVPAKNAGHHAHAPAG